MPGRRRKGQAVIEKRNETLERLTIVYVPILSVHPNDYNPNRQSEHEWDLLVSSIIEDGFTQPVLVAQCDQDHECEGVIVDGEHRWRAVKHVAALRAYAAAIGSTLAGLTAAQRIEGGATAMPDDTDIAVVKLPMGEAQAKIATLRHNRARGSEDIQMATDVLRDLERLGALEWAADSLDMDDAELQRLLEDIPAAPSLAGEEFSEAWAPGAPAETDPTEGGAVQVASTPAGVNADRERERRIAAASSEAERQQARLDRNVYRLHLTFGGDEADLVKGALGPKPAETILAWCRARAGIESDADLAQREQAVREAVAEAAGS